MTAKRLFPALLLLAAAISCGSPTEPSVPDGAIRVNGVIQYLNLEGGFWAIRGDDGITYDPLNGLAPALQRENTRVTVVAKIRNDVGGIHMVGPIVEIISIEVR